MPFKSPKQRRWMYAKRPDLAEEFAHPSKKVSKMQPRYGGAGTRGRRITDDDRPLDEIGKADLSRTERTERARAGRRTRRQGAGVAAAGLGTVGAGEVHRYVEASRGSRNPITTLPPGRPSTADQMVRIPGQVKSSYNIQQLGNSKSKVSFGNRLKAAGKDVGTIARHSPHGAVGLAGAGVIATGTGMQMSGRLREIHHKQKIAEMRKRDDTRSGTQKTSDRARAAAEVGGAGMVATSLAPNSVRQAQHIIRDTRGDTRYIRNRPVMQQARLRGLHAVTDVTTRPRGAALLGSGALLAGAAPIALGAKLKAKHDQKVGKLDDRGRRRARNAAIGAGVGGAAGGAGLTYGTIGLARSAMHAERHDRVDYPTRADFKVGFRPKGVGRDIQAVARAPGGKKALLKIAGIGAAVPAAAGAGIGAVATRRRKVEKAERYYDPEHSRQRRIGAAEAGLTLTGAAGLGEGGRRIYVDTRDMRKIKVRGPHRTPDTPLRAHPGASGSFRIRKLPAGLAAGGAAAVGGAAYLNRRASTRRGAAYR